MPRSRFRFSILFTAATSCATAAEPPNAVAIFDAYLAHAAQVVPEYRTELRAAESDEPKAPGRMHAHGSIVGTFTFRPKTYSELTRAERAVLLRDPRFRAFLVALRTQVDRPRTDNAGHPGSLLPPSSGVRPSLEQLEISPEEMLQRRPMFVVMALP